MPSTTVSRLLSKLPGGASPSPKAAPGARAPRPTIRRLDDGARVEMHWLPLAGQVRPHAYTLLALADAQARDDIVRRMFPAAAAPRRRRA